MKTLIKFGMWLLLACQPVACRGDAPDKITSNDDSGDNPDGEDAKCAWDVGLAVPLSPYDSFKTDTVFPGCGAGKAKAADDAACEPVEGRWAGTFTDGTGQTRDFAMTMTLTSSVAFTGTDVSCLEYGFGNTCFSKSMSGKFANEENLAATYTYLGDGPDSFEGGYPTPHPGEGLFSYDMQASYWWNRIAGTFRNTGSGAAFDFKACRERTDCCLPQTRYGVQIKLEDARTHCDGNGTCFYYGVPCGSKVVIRDGDYEEALREEACTLYRGARQRPGTYEISVQAQGYKPYSETITVNADCNACNLLAKIRTLKLTLANP